MKEYPQVLIVKLDTGFLIISENERHSIASNDKLIAKVRVLLDIPSSSKKKAITAKAEPVEHIEPKPPKTTNLKDAIVDARGNKLKFGILSEFTQNGKWPIKVSDYLVPELVSIPTNDKVKFAETDDGGIFIEYKTGRIYTTWDEITDMLSEITPGSELLNVPVGFSSNQRTCIRQFMLAIRGGLKQGDSIEIDPDKDFRKQLNSSSVIEHERGTLETLD